MQKICEWVERIPIKRRAVSITLLIVAMSVIMVTGTMGAYASRMLVSQITGTRAHLAGSTADSITERLQEALRVAKLVLSQEFVTDAMERVSLGRSYPLSEQIRDERRIGEFVRSMESSSDFVRVRILLCGDAIYANEQVNFFIMSEEQRAHLMALRDRGEYYEITEGEFPYIFQNTRRVISVTYPKMSSNSFTTVDGGVAIDIDTGEVLELMRNMLVSHGDAVTLYDAEGKVLLSVGDEMPGRLSSADVPLNTWHQDEDAGVMFYNMQLETGKWLLSYRVNEASMYSQVNELLSSMILILAVVLIIALVLTIIATGANNRRILKLSAAMDRVRGGDMDVRVEEGGSNEVGIMEHSFNYLLDELRTMLDMKVKSARQMAELEMRLLQSQIKPHFLYNSLDLICWRLLKMGDDRGARYVQALAQFYKIGLSRGSELIPLSDELRHVQLYVEIQNFRLDGAVELKITMPQNCQGIAVPGNILQPLVENSINAGIMEKPDRRGRIWIECTDADGVLEILISDDGIGMDIEAMRDLLCQRSDSHYGVWNVNKRLQLRFGEKAGLGYARNAEGGVDAHVRIPHGVEGKS